jgi:acyl-CoA reductase-like NAD-dependent aldehyde dehydrogenase
VQKSVAEELVFRLTTLLGQVKYGDPLCEQVMVGAVINRSQADRIADYVEQGAREGAKLHAGGDRKGVGQGLYFEPTVFTGVTPNMTIAREEIFGPVLSVLTFDTPQEAVQIANGTEYGLSASVWTRDIGLGLGTIQKIRAGKTWINGVIASYPEMPFGGFKQSGNGRETGAYGFDQYSEFKTVHALYGKRDLWIKSKRASDSSEVLNS